MPSQLQAVTYDAQDPAALGNYWARLLGRDVVEEPDGVFLPGSDSQVGLRFVAATEEIVRPRYEYLHLHLTSTSLEDQQRTVDRVLGLGGRHLDVGQLPEEGHIVVADPEGNALCVIEPGNNYLAGTGHLGEVACDGRREVGVFWAEALGWPLGWDQDDETAIQSPAGGTKLAWGGARDEPKTARSPQRFDLTTSDVAAEVERLVGLGATRLADRAGLVELGDPDGTEFSLRAG